MALDSQILSSQATQLQNYNSTSELSEPFDYQFNDSQLMILLNFNPMHVSYAMLLTQIEEMRMEVPLQ